MSPQTSSLIEKMVKVLPREFRDAGEPCHGEIGAHLPDRLDRLSTFECLRGVRHIAQAEPDDFLARDDVVRGVGRLHEFGLTYDILVYAHQLPAALALVERLPGQPFVVDHMAKPKIREGELEPWATHMRQLAGHPNTCCKVSGLVTEAFWEAWEPGDIRPYLDVIFEAFGADRLIEHLTSQANISAIDLAVNAGKTGSFRQAAK